MIGKFLPAAFAKNVIARARIGSDEVAHIFDHAEHRHGDGFEHAQRAAHVDEGNFLRRGYQHRALHRDQLRQAQLYVAGSRRHVHDQIIEFAPLHIRKKLLHQPMQDRAAHNQRFVAGLQDSH